MISIASLNGLGEAWAGIMTRALVDSTVLLVIMLVVWLPLRRRISAHLAHGLFCLILLRLAVPQSPSWPNGLPTPSVRETVGRVSAWVWPPVVIEEPLVAPAPVPAKLALTLPTTGDLGAAPADEPTRAVEPANSSLPRPVKGDLRPRTGLTPTAGLMMAWALISLVMLARFARALWSTHAILRNALPVNPEYLTVDVDALQRAVGLRKPVRWAVSPVLRTPAVGGLFWPTVMMPPDLEDGLTDQQLRWVLLHELAHVRRRDLWIVMGQRLVQCVFFFHPAAHAANWVIDQLREYACDDTALAASRASRRDCGEGFLTVVSRSVESNAAVAALGLFESRMLIRRRLVRILDPHRQVPARLSTRASLGLIVAGAMVVAFGRTPNVGAHPRKPLEPVAAPLRLVDPVSEPLTYRPGDLWHSETPDARGPAARESVLALAYSPDGKTLATAGEGPAVVLRDVATGRVVAQLSGHSDAVAALAFSPDGRSLASAGYDGTVRLWDVAGGRERAVLKGHTNWVFALAFSPNGATLASGGHDKTVRLWNLAEGRARATLSSQDGSVRALAFSTDGKTLASAGADHLITLWDLATLASRGKLEGHKGTVRALAFAPGRNPTLRLASAGEDGEVRLWDAADGRTKLVSVLVGHPDMAVCLAFSPGGTTLASGGLDATVKLWDPASGRERATLRGHHDGVSALAFAPGARRLASAGFDGAVRLWEPAAPAFSPAICLNVGGPARGLDFTPDGRTLLTSSTAGFAQWNVLTGSALTPAGATSKPEATGPLAVAPDGALVALGTSSGTLRLVDPATGRLLFEGKGHRGEIRTVAFAPSGRALATGGSDGSVIVWDVVTHRALREFHPNQGAIATVRFTRDSTALVCATGRGLILWGAGGRVVASIVDSPRVSSAVSIAPDGSILATVDDDGSISLRDTVTLALRNTFRSERCRSLAFAADGRTLATALASGEVVLWDSRDGRQLGSLRGHHGEVTDVAFAPGDRTLAAAGRDGTVKLWNLAARRVTASAELKPEPACPWSVVYSASGDILAVADGRPDTPGIVTLWDAESHRNLRTLEGHDRGVASVALSHDGRLVASGGFDQTVRMYDGITGSLLYVLDGLDGVVTDLAFSPDDSLLATAGEANALTLWDAATGAEKARLGEFQGRIQSVAFSPDGRFIAAVGGVFANGPAARGEVKVWDLTSNRPRDGFQGHTRGVVALAFSPDGSTLATGGVDESIRLWDLSTARPRLTLSGLPGCVLAVAFAQDGKTLAWGGRNDGLVVLHDTSNGEEVTRLVGHTTAVRSLAFSPDGLTLTTAADRSIKLWDVSGAGIK